MGMFTEREEDVPTSFGSHMARKYADVLFCGEEHKPAKVYVVISRKNEIRGIYSTKHKAQVWVNRYKGLFDIEEYRLDPNPL